MRKNSRVKVSQTASLMNTPWMRAEYPDDVVEVLPGRVWFVSTPGHGGFAVTKEIASRLSPWAKSHGISKGGYLWFEEDVAWRALTLEIPEFAQADYEQSKTYNDWGTFDEFMAYSVETAKRYLGHKGAKVAQVDRKGNPLAVGDSVVYSRDFLQSVGLLTGDIPQDRGTIVRFEPFGDDRQLAVVQWDIQGENAILTTNLTRKDKIHLEGRSAGIVGDIVQWLKDLISGLKGSVDELERVVNTKSAKARKAQTDASPEVAAAIKEFLALKEQIAELNKRKGQVQAELETAFVEAEREMIRADGIVYTAIQHDVPSRSYAKAFAAALTKVNAATRKVLEAVLEAHTEFGDKFNLRPVKSAWNSDSQDYKTTKPITAQTFNYTGHGWEGESYDRSLSTKDIAAKVREYVKSKYPAYTFSIRYESFAGGSAINISLMSGPEEPFADGKRHEQLNQFSLDERSGLRQPVLGMMQDVYRYVSSFNFDDSDAQIDYFHTNFYVSLDIGKWDKPYVKTARLLAQARSAAFDPYDEDWSVSGKGGECIACGSENTHIQYQHVNGMYSVKCDDCGNSFVTDEVPAKEAQSHGHKLMTQEIIARMPALYATEETPMSDKVVQVKFFTPDSNWSWFGIEYDPVDRLFFGLVAGLYPEFGYFSLDELESVTGPMGLPIERDMYFSPKTVAEVVRTEGVDIHVAESKKPTQSMLAARPIRKIK